MLELEGISHGFGGKALFSIDRLEILGGKHLLILGKSGSGKTTLLNIIGGLLRPAKGAVWLEKTNIYSLTNNARDKLRGLNIGFIFQKLHLIPTLSVMENLLLANYLAGKKQNRPHGWKILEALGLKHKKNAYPENLSFGEAQRTAIARALMNEPKIIIADEPTSALDDESCASVIQLLISEASQRNCSLIVATHDHRIKDFFPDRITL